MHPALFHEPCELAHRDGVIALGSCSPVGRAPRYVAIGGGTGLPSVLEGLCGLDAGQPRDPDAVTALVTVTDDGGSSGRLRRLFGVPPPGDARNCLAAVAHPDSPLRSFLQHRFESADALNGHSIGNLLLAALTQMTGDFSEAVQQLGDLVGVRGRVLPTTAENVHLRAEMASGDVLLGETAIAGSPEAIRRVSLVPSARPLPEALRALVNADVIVVGPGSLYTSVLPNLLVEGLAATISGVNAVRIFVANLMTEPGETDGYSLGDHLHAIRSHTGFDLFDYVLVNSGPVDPAIAARYAARGAFPVVADCPPEWAGGARLVGRNLAAEYAIGKIRHAPAPLAEAIRALAACGRPSSTVNAEQQRMCNAESSRCARSRPARHL